MISNIRHQNHLPGDVIRDPKTKEDYVVQAVFGAAAGAGITILAIALYGKKIFSSTLANEMELADKYPIIRKNLLQKSPADIKKEINDRLTSVLKHDQTLITNINKPENKVLKDLLFVASEGSETTFPKSIIELAESIVEQNGSAPSIEGMRNELIKLTHGTSVTENLIDDLAKTLHEHAYNYATSQPYLGVGLSPSSVLLPFSKNESKTSDTFNLFRATAGEFDGKKTLHLGGKTTRYTKGIAEDETMKKFLSLISSNEVTPDSYILGESAHATPENRLAHLYGKYFGFSSEKLEKDKNFIANDVAQAKRGKITRSVKVLMEKNDREIMKLIESGEKTRKNYREKNRYPHLADSYRKNTAISPYIRNLKSLGKRVDFEAFVKSSDKISGQFMSLDLHTFHNDLISGTELTYKDKKLDLRTAYGRETISKLLDPEERQNIILGPGSIERILKQKKDLNSGPITLESIAAESSVIKERLAQLDTELLREAPGASLAMVRRDLDLSGNNAAIGRITGNTLDRDDLKNLPKLSENHKRIYYVENPQGKIHSSHSWDALMRHISSDPDYEGHDKHKFFFMEQHKDLAEKGNTVRTLNDKEAIDVRSNAVPILTPQEAIDNVAPSYAPQIAPNHNVRISMAPQTEEEAFEKGFQSQLVALVRIKDKQTIIGSDSQTPIKQHIKRAYEFMSHKEQLTLDIESTGNGAGTRLTQIGLGNHNVSGISKANQVSEILKAAEIIDKHQYIGTQGRTDLEVLLRILLHEEETPEIARAKGILKKAIDHKLVDLQVIYQVAGESLGNTSQAELVAKNLGKVQLHTAAGDNAEAKALIDIYKEKFFENYNSLEFLSDPSGHYMFNEMGLGPTPKARRIFSVQTDHSTGQLQAVFERLHVQDNEFVPSGQFYTENFSGASSFGAYNQRNVHTFEPNSTQMAQYVQQYKKTLQDSSDRQVRAVFNPGEKNFWDRQTLYNYDSKTMGPFSHVKLASDQDAARLYAAGQQLIEASQSPGNFNPNRLIGEAKRLVAEDAQIHKGTNDVYRNMVEDTLVRMFTDKEEAAVITDASSSNYAKLLQSPVGQAMAASAREGIGEITNNQSQVYMNVLIGLASAHNEATKSLEESKSLTRFSVSLFGVTGKANFNPNNPRATVLEATRDLSAKILFDINKSEHISDEHKALLKSIGVSEHDFRRVAEFVHGDIKKDLTEWKKAISSLSGSNNPEAYEFNRIHQMVIDSKEVRGALEAAFDIRSADSEQRGVAGGLFESAEKFAEANGGRKFVQGLDQAIIDAQKDSHKKRVVESIMTEEYKAFDYSKTIDFMNQQDVSSVAKSISERFKEIHQTFGGISTHDERFLAGSEEEFLHRTAAEKQVAWGEGERGITNQAHIGKKIIDEVAEQGNKYRASTPPTGDSGHLDLHAMINKAQASIGTIEMPKEAESAASSAAAVMAGGTEATKQLQHELVGNWMNGMKSNSVVAPFLAIGGALALLGLTAPTDDQFTQGKISDYRRFDPLIANSEIPGEGNLARVWYGEEKPFRIDLNFKGFVNSKSHHDDLVTSIYNAIDSEYTPVYKKTAFNDRRNNDDNQAAIKYMRSL